MTDTTNDHLHEFELRLQALTESFEQQLRARGFDPAQAETAALPTKLAHMYQERLTLLAEVEELRMSTPTEHKKMTEVDRIIDQYRRAFEGEAWHGPSVLRLLDGVSAAQAAAHPIAGAHSIWELVLHIAAWERACKRRLEGDRAQLTDEEDWQRIEDTSDAAWERTKQDLIDNHRELVDAVSSLDEARLDQPIIVDPTAVFSTVYVTLHGGVQHDLYHAGQIGILKKALEGVAS